jgi:hypothetical protein
VGLSDIALVCFRLWLVASHGECRATVLHSMLERCSAIELEVRGTLDKTTIKLKSGSTEQHEANKGRQQAAARMNQACAHHSACVFACVVF